MSIKYVSDTKAGRVISAYVILKDGEQVAVVRAHYSESVCTVNVFDTKGENARGFQVGRASGYGYNKFNSAISGLFIQGIQLKDADLYQLENHGMKVIQAI